MMRAYAFLAAFLLAAVMLLMYRNWADFRQGMDYPFQHNCQCK